MAVVYFGVGGRELNGTINYGWIRDTFTRSLHVINYPDSPAPACGVQPYALYLGGNPNTLSLPNQPNYALGPLPALAADAGNDQTICRGDTLLLGGTDNDASLSYQWLSADSAWSSSAPRPTISPADTTIYYLYVEDSGANYSCNARWDTVIVTVLPYEPTQEIIDTAVLAGTVFLGTLIKSDTTFTRHYTTTAGCDSTVVFNVSLITALPQGHPGFEIVVSNIPASGGLWVKQSGDFQPLHFRLYNLLGRPVLQASLRQPLTRLSTAILAEGVYLWDAMPTQPGSRKPVRGKVCLVQ